MNANYPHQLYLSANLWEDYAEEPIPSARLAEIVEETAGEYGIGIKEI